MRSRVEVIRSDRRIAHPIATYAWLAAAFAWLIVAFAWVTAIVSRVLPLFALQDESELVYLSGDREKSLPLSAVSTIAWGQKTAIFHRHLRPDKENQSFSIIFCNGERTIDVICKDTDEAEMWFVGLGALVEKQRRTQSERLGRQAVVVAERGTQDWSPNSSPFFSVDRKPQAGGSATASPPDRLSPDVAPMPASKSAQDISTYPAADDRSSDGDDASDTASLSGFSVLSVNHASAANAQSILGVNSNGGGGAGGVGSGGGGGGVASGSVTIAGAAGPGTSSVPSTTSSSSSSWWDKSSASSRTESGAVAQGKPPSGMWADAAAVTSHPSTTSSAGEDAGGESLGDLFMWGEGLGEGALGGGGMRKKGGQRMVMGAEYDSVAPKALESGVVLDICRVACAEEHAALVTRQGEVLCWGEESGGRLGQGVEKDVEHPQLVEALGGLRVDQVRSGVRRLASARENKVACKRGQGQSGLHVCPHALGRCVHMGERAQVPGAAGVACGTHFTCALTRGGDVYIWGDGRRCQGLLGSGGYGDMPQWVPRRLGGPLDGVHVVQVACGPWHVAVVAGGGEVFTFGDGTFGALGHGNCEVVPVPRQVQALQGYRTLRVACGVWHTAAVVDTCPSGDGSGGGNSSSSGMGGCGQVFTWGDGDGYKLGHGDKQQQLLPTLVNALRQESCSQVACGESVTVAVTAEGQVYTWGSAEYGQLGNPQADGKLPARVAGPLLQKQVEQVACGAHHVAALTTTAHLFTWGRGANGRLGHGDVKDRDVPTAVTALKDRRVLLASLCAFALGPALYPTLPMTRSPVGRPAQPWCVSTSPSQAPTTTSATSAASPSPSRAPATAATTAASPCATPVAAASCSEQPWPHPPPAPTDSVSASLPALPAATHAHSASPPLRTSASPPAKPDDSHLRTSRSLRTSVQAPGKRSTSPMLRRSMGTSPLRRASSPTAAQIASAAAAAMAAAMAGRMPGPTPASIAAAAAAAGQVGPGGIGGVGGMGAVGGLGGVVALPGGGGTRGGSSVGRVGGVEVAGAGGGGVEGGEGGGWSAMTKALEETSEAERDTAMAGMRHAKQNAEREAYRLQDEVEVLRQHCQLLEQERRATLELAQRQVEAAVTAASEAGARVAGARDIIQVLCAQMQELLQQAPSIPVKQASLAIRAVDDSVLYTGPLLLSSSVLPPSLVELPPLPVSGSGGAALAAAPALATAAPGASVGSVEGCRAQREGGVPWTPTGASSDKISPRSKWIGGGRATEGAAAARAVGGREAGSFAGVAGAGVARGGSSVDVSARESVGVGGSVRGSSPFEAPARWTEASAERGSSGAQLDGLSLRNSQGGYLGSRGGGAMGERQERRTLPVFEAPRGESSEQQQQESKSRMVPSLVRLHESWTHLRQRETTPERVPVGVSVGTLPPSAAVPPHVPGPSSRRSLPAVPGLSSRSSVGGMRGSLGGGRESLVQERNGRPSENLIGRLGGMAGERDVGGEGKAALGEGDESVDGGGGSGVREAGSTDETRQELNFGCQGWENENVEPSFRYAALQENMGQGEQGIDEEEGGRYGSQADGLLSANPHTEQELHGRLLINGLDKTGMAGAGGASSSADAATGACTSEEHPGMLTEETVRMHGLDGIAECEEEGRGADSGGGDDRDGSQSEAGSTSSSRRGEGKGGSRKSTRKLHENEWVEQPEQGVYITLSKLPGAQGEAASADMAAVRDAREKLPQLLNHLGVTPRDTFNLDETALWLSVLPRRTYSNGRIPGRKVSKDRLTVAFLVNADGSHMFRPLVISKAKRPHDFRPDYDPEALCYWQHNAKGWMTSPLFTHFISQLNSAMYAEGRKVVVLLDNASSHMLRSEHAWSEVVCGMRTTCMSNVRLVFLPPNTTSFTQPLDQGIIATAKARYRQHWLRAFSALWNADGATSAVARYRPNLRDVVGWLSDAWTSVGVRTIQRCWWRTGCLPLSWSLELPHVHDDEPVPPAYPDIEIDDDIDDAVYDDADPVGCEARRTARAACEMLIGYARATRITPRDLCHLFDIRNPVIIARMERASPSFNLNVAPQPVPTPGATPTPETPRPRGRVLPGWMTQPSRRQQLLDAGVGAVMDGYVDAAEWMRL
ncbi:unnamed protein product [Closterium sp. Naga37s-1]|nr:unnamed protein product [Closterium sp. Naga37s-1]